LQAIQTIAVINGRPCLYSDGLVAVVKGHPHYEWMKEEPIESGGTVTGYTCTIKRKNHPEHSVTFTIEDAKAAALWGKPGPWTNYKSRMLQMRARAFCVRDAFPDALMGMSVAEEVNDYQVDAKPVKSTASDALKDLLTKKKNALEPIKTIVLATVEQIEEIKTLIVDKDFSQHRIDAACKHYNVNDIHALDYHQANDFISQLNKKIN